MDEQAAPAPVPPTPVSYKLTEWSYTEGERDQRSLKTAVTKTDLNPAEEKTIRQFVQFLVVRDYTELFKVKLPKPSNDSKAFLLVHEITYKDGDKEKVAFLNQQL